MAATMLPAPGPGGPCDEPCRHPGCGLIHEQARTECPGCNHPIGFGTWFVEGPDGELIHSACWSDLYESRPEAYGTPVADDPPPSAEKRVMDLMAALAQSVNEAKAARDRHFARKAEQ